MVWLPPFNYTNNAWLAPKYCKVDGDDNRTRTRIARMKTLFPNHLEDVAKCVLARGVGFEPTHRRTT